MKKFNIILFSLQQIFLLINFKSKFIKIPGGIVCLDKNQKYDQTLKFANETQEQPQFYRASNLSCWNNSGNVALIDSDFKIYKKLGFGLEHFCLINILNKILCTGDNEQGQSSTPTELTIVNKLTLGSYHTCVSADITGANQIPDFAVKCWGNDQQGQTSVLSELRFYVIQKLKAGAFFTCGMFYKYMKQNLICWGRNSYNLFKKHQNGNITNTNNANANANININNKVTSMPHQIANSMRKIEISIGEEDTICAFRHKFINIGRKLWCWGKCMDDMCNIPKSYQYNNIIISTGINHACTIFLPNNQLGCWGGNRQGQISVEHKYKKYMINVVAGEYYTCVQKNTGALKCYGLLQLIPETLKNWTQDVSIGGRNQCVNEGGIIKCYGLERRDIEVHVLTTSRMKEKTISMGSGWDYFCSILVSGQIQCCGINNMGQLEVPNQIRQNQKHKDSNQVQQDSVPDDLKTQPIQSLTNSLFDKSKAINISVGLLHSCAIINKKQQTGRVLCWGGQNEYGQLNPPMLNLAKLVSVGDEHTCIFGVFLYCYGNNQQGQTDILRYNGQIRNITSGGDHNCIELDDRNNIPEQDSEPSDLIQNKLICWGSNNQGQTSIPEKQKGLQPWINAKAGAVQTCVISLISNRELQGQIECWGMLVPSMNKEVKEWFMVGIEVGQQTNCVWDLEGRRQCWGEQEADSGSESGSGSGGGSEDDEQ